jgi:7-alpha-hydroxysteroid dehydrogenase
VTGVLDQFKLTGYAAVVTGAGRGIGAATALALAEAGADVAIASRSVEQLDEVAARIRAAGRRALVVPADLKDTEAAAKLAHAAFEEFGRLDIVVNNVGGAMPRPFLDTRVDHLERAFHFNVATAHALTVAAVPLMLSTDDGAQKSVLGISSAVGRVAARGYVAYGTAKAALAHWIRLAASDLAPRVRVNGVAVGAVLTSALEVVATSPELARKIEGATPLGRIGAAEDVAAAVVYLSSPAGRYLTGKLLEVDGGIQQPNLDLGLPDL